jgi:class 3 adenylate cyclase
VSKPPHSDPTSSTAAGADSGGATADGPRRRRKLSAIMMVDVSGFSRLMGSDEEKTVGLILDFQRGIKGMVQEFEGRVVDTAGDSAFVEFDSVVNAVRCARRIQEEQSRLNSGRSDAECVVSRIGIHLGDVIVEDYNVYGDGVNIAARLEPLADPGGICLSEAVYQQVRNKLELPVQDIGLRELKNIEHPIRLYKVPPLPRLAASESAPARAPVPATAAMDGQGLSEARIEAAVQSWLDDVIRAKRLIPLIVGIFLLLSPAILFRTGGVFPTAGAILVGTVLGRVWALRTGRPGGTRLGLGLGIALGGLLTGWSGVTNALFVLAGLIVAATGLAGGGKATR